MFVDEVKVKLKAGDGGHGCLSFRREAYEPEGGPNGGNGGKGGDVILVGDNNTSDLTDYQFKPQAKADNGQPGQGSDKNGACGKDCLLRLPPGTVVFDAESGEMITEVTAHGEEIILLEGGRGGRGNASFKTSINQTPRQTTPGTPGQEGQYRLVLKTIADVGLVGYPNAGKSSLLRETSRSRAKVGHYPFTTIHPNVGVVEYPEIYERITMADIPGLIEGASENRGLGHRFLRHIERCRVLLFVLDMAGTEERDPLEDYQSLCQELRAYDPALAEKPRLVAANKMDELPAAEEHLKRFRKAHPHLQVMPISCLSEEGLPELLEALRKAVRLLVDR